jgi:lactate permease
MVWLQTYNPLGNAWLSTLVAAIPIVVLLGALGIFRIKAHLAAIYGLIASLLVATIVYGMPVSMAGETAVFGAAFGLMPIGWIILNVIFLYQLTLERGYFKVMQDSIAGVSQDRRLQLLLIAFCFGAFFEGRSIKPWREEHRSRPDVRLKRDSYFRTSCGFARVETVSGAIHISQSDTRI